MHHRQTLSSLPSTSNCYLMKVYDGSFVSKDDFSTSSLMVKFLSLNKESPFAKCTRVQMFS